MRPLERQRRSRWIETIDGCSSLAGTGDDGGNECRRRNVIQSFPISGGADAEVYDEKTGLIFVSTREGWFHIFHEDSPDHYSETGKVKTEFGAETMAYDPRMDRIFVDTAEFGKAPEPTKEHPHPRATGTRSHFTYWCTRSDGGSTY